MLIEALQALLAADSGSGKEHQNAYLVSRGGCCLRDAHLRI
jgi:hypothetical protein